MTELAYPLPEIGEPSVAADPRTLEALINIKAWAQGQIDSTNLKAGGIETVAVKNEAITEAKLSSAVAALLNSKSSGIAFKTYAGPATLKSGELAEQTKSGETFTLPSVTTANQIIGVFAGETTTAKVSAAGATKIYGDFIKAATTITLLPLQHVTLQSNGTAWIITAGEAKHEQTFSAATSRTLAEYETAGIEPSATRFAQVVVAGQSEGSSLVKPLVGGVALPQASVTASGGLFLTLPVPPGQKWKLNVSGSALSAVTSSNLLL